MTVRPLHSAVLLLLFALPAVGQQKPKKSLTDLRKDLHKIAAKRDKIHNQLKQVKREAKAVVGDIKAVDSRLTSLEDQLGTTQDRLVSSREDAKRVAQQLKIATAAMEAQRKVIGVRLRSMYMQENPTIVSVFMGSKNLGDVASRQILFERIAQKDREAFDGYRKSQREVADKQHEAKALVGRIANLLEEEKGRKQDLTQARQQKEGYLQELKDREGQLREMEQQFADDEAEITNQIQVYLRDLAKQQSKPGHKPTLGAFSGRFSRPVSAGITSGFGYRFHPILHRSRLHAGVDFGASSGTPIHAAADGIVVAANRMGGYGNVVILDHGGGYSTVYGHCSRLHVSAGQKVSRGQIIANVGSTGLSTGPHLHFEVRINGRPVNPLGKL